MSWQATIPSNSTCPLFASQSRISFTNNLSFSSMFVIKPTCLILDFLGHILLLINLYKQSPQSKSAYRLKIYEAVSKATLSICSGLKLLLYNGLSGADNTTGVDGFRRIYWLMWTATHVAIPLEDAATTAVLFFAFFTSIDRSYAIAWPAKYKLRNKRRWELVILSISIVISVALSIFVCFLFRLDFDGERIELYKITIDPEFLSNYLLSSALSNLRNAAWIIGAISVTISGSILIYLYRKRNRQVSTMTTSGGQHNQAARNSNAYAIRLSNAYATAKDLKRRETETTLFVLTLYQSFQIVNQISIMTAHSMLNLMPGFAECQGLVFSSVRNIWLAVVNASDFYVMLLVNRPFRESMKKNITKKTPCACTKTTVWE